MTTRLYIAKLITDLSSFAAVMNSLSRAEVTDIDDILVHLKDLNVSVLNPNTHRVYDGFLFAYEGRGICGVMNIYMAHYSAKCVIDGDYTEINAAFDLMDRIVDKAFARSEYYSGSRIHPVQGGEIAYHESDFWQKWITGDYAAARRAMLQDVIIELSYIFAGE